jgi:hypothetical protein
MTIEQALRRTADLLADARDSGWTPWSAAEIRSELLEMLAMRARGEEIDENRLRLLFLPTGPVQETSMANGWSEEMLRIAEAVDRYLGDA